MLAAPILLLILPIILCIGAYGKGRIRHQTRFFSARTWRLSRRDHPAGSPAVERQRAARQGPKCGAGNAIVPLRGAGRGRVSALPYRGRPDWWALALDGAATLGSVWALLAARLRPNKRRTRPGSGVPGARHKKSGTRRGGPKGRRNRNHAPTPDFLLTSRYPSLRRMPISRVGPLAAGRAARAGYEPGLRQWPVLPVRGTLSAPFPRQSGVRRGQRG